MTIRTPAGRARAIGGLAPILAVTRGRARRLTRIADYLRDAAGADDCEIFLREPGAGDLVMAECRGRDRSALLGTTRFPAGAGFPGIIAATGSALLSRSVRRDARFLRRTAAARGVAAFAGTPLFHGSSVVGCVNLAWRDARAPIEAAAALLADAAGLISDAIQADLLAARERVECAVNAADDEPQAMARACLTTIAGAASVTRGTLVLFDRNGRADAAASLGPQTNVCSAIIGRYCRCPALDAGHGSALSGPRDAWPDDCRCLPAAATGPLCLPIRARNRLRGAIVMDRGPAVPNPPTRDLVPLLSMAAAAAAWLAPPDAPAAAPARVHHRGDAMLELRCLGPFEVRLDGQPIHDRAFSRHKALTLLKLLVIQGGKPVSRDALIERLWPGADSEHGRNRLHVVVHALRSVIEPFHQQRRWLYIRNVGELYTFDTTSPHWIDMIEFRRRTADARTALTERRADDAIRHLEAAAALYRGELFAEERYATWCEPERTELRLRYHEIVRRLAELSLQRGDVDGGIAWLRNGLLSDPLREDLLETLLSTLVANGRRHEASAHYAVWERLARDEPEAGPRRPIGWPDDPGRHRHAPPQPVSS